jgi:hypothetical protein
MEGHDMQYPVTRRTAVQAAVAALLLTALAACSSSSGADRDTATAQTVATEPPTTTTTNPYAVPAVIDAAYVNRVLAGLDALMGDTTRLIIRTKTITQEAYDRLKSLYANNQLLQLVLDALQDELRSGFADYIPNPGNKSTTVTQIVTGNSRCIFVRVHRDYSAVAVDPTAVNPQWVSLKPLDLGRDPNGYNPTSWGVVYDGFTRERSQPADPCAGS